MGPERAGEGSCAEDAYMARATAAVLTGVLHSSFEDVAVVETSRATHESIYSTPFQKMEVGITTLLTIPVLFYSLGRVKLSV